MRMGNIQNGRISWDSLVYTDKPEEIVKYELGYDDVLFNRTNSAEHVGKSGIFKSDRHAIFAGYLIRLHLKRDRILPDFMNYYLNSRPAREHGRRVMSQSVHQANINGTKLRAYPITVPAIEEQKRIVDELYMLERESQQLQDVYGNKLAFLSQLRQSLLQKAFAGELTAESASLAPKSTGAAANE